MIRVALSSFPNEESAAQVARHLVEEHLVACGTVLAGARSVYRWQGAIEESPEVLVIFKMDPGTYSRFADRLQQLHPYDLPELVAWDAPEGSPAYAKWARSACQPDTH
jgi:periplasmic divalent cation tolerance protein